MGLTIGTLLGSMDGSTEGFLSIDGKGLSDFDEVGSKLRMDAGTLLGNTIGSGCGSRLGTDAGLETGTEVPSPDGLVSLSDTTVLGSVVNITPGIRLRDVGQLVCEMERPRK